MVEPRRSSRSVLLSEVPARLRVESCQQDGGGPPVVGGGSGFVKAAISGIARFVRPWAQLDKSMMADSCAHGGAVAGLVLVWRIGRNCMFAVLYDGCVQIRGQYALVPIGQEDAALETHGDGEHVGAAPVIPGFEREQQAGRERGKWGHGGVAAGLEVQARRGGGESTRNQLGSSRRFGICVSLEC